MTAAARALLESVRGDPEFSERLRSYSMEDKLLLTLDSPEREKWAYWPTERSGLSFDLMHAKHRALTHELLWLLLSNRGYHKLLNIMQLENVLQPASGTGFPRGIEDYSVTLFGEPSDTVPWAWRFEGHHISLSITVAPGQGFTVTPTFFGADPADVMAGPLAGLRVLRVEEDLGLQLANSLTAAQRAPPIVPGTPEWNRTGGFTYPNDMPWDIVAATILRDRSDWNSWKTELQPDGIAFKDLNGAQQATLLAILDEIFTTYRPEIADDLSRVARPRRLALRVDRRPEERRAALLPHPDARLPVRVRQRAGQREPHPRGVAQPRGRLRRGLAAAPSRRGALDAYGARDRVAARRELREQAVGRDELAHRQHGERRGMGRERVLGFAQPFREQLVAEVLEPADENSISRQSPCASG